MKPAKPLPLYINLIKLDTFDLQALMLLVDLLCRFQDRYAYFKFIDNSEKTIDALQHLGAERILDRLFLDYPCEPVSCTA